MDENPTVAPISPIWDRHSSGAIVLEQNKNPSHLDCATDS
jgi:hypothetical protein